MSDLRKVVIDCDTGIDDAMALTIACASGSLDILAVTTVAGNTTVENSTRNTCNVLHFLGRDEIPVGRGASEPLARPLFTAGSVHGKTGLRGWNFSEDYTGNLSPLPAVELLAKVIGESEEPVTIIALGPVTNIEAFLRLYPEMKGKVREIVFMGTSYHSGNPTALSTFNVLVDPEAFRMVIHSGVPVTACPLDTTRKSFLNLEDRKRIQGVGNKVSSFVSSILSGYGELLPDKNDGEEGSDASIALIQSQQEADVEVPMHDPTTVAYVVRPELFSGNKYYADVECKGEITLGFTFIDKEDYYRKSPEERNILFLEDVDRKGFVDLFVESIRKYR